MSFKQAERKTHSAVSCPFAFVVLFSWRTLRLFAVVIPLPRGSISSNGRVNSIRPWDLGALGTEEAFASESSGSPWGPRPVESGACIGPWPECRSEPRDSCGRSQGTCASGHHLLAFWRGSLCRDGASPSLGPGVTRRSRVAPFPHQRPQAQVM